MVNAYERRGSSPSITAALFNPINNMKSAYIGTSALPTVLMMAHSGSLTLAPYMWIGESLRGVGLLKGGALLSKHPSLLSPLFNVWRSPGVGETIEGIGKSLKLNPDQIQQMVKGARTYMKAHRFSPINEKKFVSQMITSMNIKSNKQLTRVMSKKILPTLLPKMKAAATISSVGTVLTAAYVGIVAADVISHLTGFAFKGVTTTLRMIDAAAVHARALEFSGRMSVGFKTPFAATERQRLMQELQRQHLPGSRVLGNEASDYARII